MKTSITTLFVFLITLTISAQETGIKEFIPAGYALLETATGDLNSDGYDDYLLVLNYEQEHLVPDTIRPLLILHGQQDGTFKKVATSNDIVLCFGCGGVFGDPFAGVTVLDNSFTIAHYGGSSWRWAREVTFKYDKQSDKYILHQDMGESFHTSEHDKKESHTYQKDLWGKVEFENYKSDW